MAARGKAVETEIGILEVQRGRLEVALVGTTPFICNRMSEKVWRELLLPKGKKTAADKASTLKHNPHEEFQASPYRFKDPKAPTLLGHLASAFKAAMMTAALDMPGAKKAQIGRLVTVEGEMVHLYGIPRLFMSVVRSADIGKTPDIRTRAIIPEWAAKLSITFVRPLLREQAVANLLAAAGLTIGVGDWRGEKGSGNYGFFRLVGPNDADFQRIVKTGGRAAQIEAMADPECYDAETEELLGWFDGEVARRGFKVAPMPNGDGAAVQGGVEA